jgi:hypothetical protein
MMKGELVMIQVEVKVSYDGKYYLTNVIADPNTTEEEIIRLAYEQVQKQWVR